MSKTRTPLINSLRKAFRLAVIAKKKGITDPAEIAGMYEHNESRRRFVRQAALGSLALGSASTLLSGCAKIEDDITASNALARKRRDPKIAIIGGGMAGLNCAYQLQKANISSTIFEASTVQADVFIPKQACWHRALLPSWVASLLTVGTKICLPLLMNLG
jgi:monoamine oxidase